MTHSDSDNINYKLPMINLNLLITLVRLSENDGSVEKTSKALGVVSGTIDNHLSRLTDDLGGGALTTNTRAGVRQITDYGHDVIRTAKELLDSAQALKDYGRRECTLAFLPQHAYIVARAQQQLKTTNPDLELRLVVLAEHHRSRTSFERHVIDPLARGALDLAIGLPAHGRPGLTSYPCLWESSRRASSCREEPLSRPKTSPTRSWQATPSAATAPSNTVGFLSRSMDPRTFSPTALWSSPTRHQGRAGTSSARSWRQSRLLVQRRT
ncbi:hypothetical protein [Amycolatopsis echigonensis]|uniref:hypothetical protein n=1 Tax=Amycolatopsis echigonensis TaxID=2576905 RepID=UPI001FE578D6|nr:hypothetical protein [Amycolatopsis echigonensis]